MSALTCRRNGFFLVAVPLLLLVSNLLIFLWKSHVDDSSLIQQQHHPRPPISKATSSASSHSEDERGQRGYRSFQGPGEDGKKPVGAQKKSSASRSSSSRPHHPDDNVNPITILRADHFLVGACDEHLSSKVVQPIHGISYKQTNRTDLEDFITKTQLALAAAPNAALFVIDPLNVLGVAKPPLDERTIPFRPTGSPEDEAVYRPEAIPSNVQADLKRQYEVTVRYLSRATCRVWSGPKISATGTRVQQLSCLLGKDNVYVGNNSRNPFQVVQPFAEFPMLLTRDILDFFIQIVSYPKTNVRAQCAYNTPLESCLGMFMSGRDYHLIAWEDVERVYEPERERGNFRYRTFSVREDYPFAIRTGPMYGIAPSTNGAPQATVQLSVDDSDTMPGRVQGWEKPRPLKKSVTAVTYVPVRLTNTVAREVIRCYWASLDAVIRNDFPLHFILGAKDRERHYFPELWSGKTRSALHKENSTYGDLVMFDIEDGDMIHATSGTMGKLILAFFHATSIYKYHYFVRGADDAYHNFAQMYRDFVAAPNPYRMYDGHKLFRWINSHAGFKNVHHDHVDASRNVAPLVVPVYLTGGGYMMSSDVIEYLVATCSIIPALPWHAEDYNIGRVVVPFTTPMENYRFHDFFNATPKVRSSFSYTVPLILDYCNPGDWVIHKNPWGTYRYVGEDHRMYCTSKDFNESSVKPHKCNSVVYGSGFVFPHRSLANEAYYMEHIFHKGRRTHVNSMQARKNFQLGGSGFESCSARHWGNFVESARIQGKLSWDARRENKHGKEIIIPFEFRGKIRI